MSTGVDLSIVVTSYNTRELVLDCLAKFCYDLPRFCNEYVSCTFTSANK